MTLVPGSRLGPYEITAPLGEGGMGVVWRATDPKLKREVAIKVLPDAFAGDADRLARFEREAQLLAQLQHPNIASIHGLEESGGVRALVMELVEGPTLAERIAGGPIPLDEALAIGGQIAGALEAAHEKGIVHRDLKPQNVKLAPDGTVKVLDFGLAKAMDPPGSPSAADLARSPTMMNSPTLTSAGTQLGVILGTAAYMSPEQARGQAVDKRADVWALGVILLEMLSGRHVFEGETVSDLLASVLTREPPWDSLPTTVGPGLRRVLARCLEKSPRKRYRDMGDVAHDLAAAPADDAARAAVAAALAGRPGSRTPRALAAVAALAIAAAAVLGALFWRQLHVPPPVLSYEKLTFTPQYVTNARFAPDGKTVVFSAARDGNVSELFVRRPEDPQARALGTKGTQLLAVSAKGELAVLTRARFLFHRTYLGTLARMPLAEAAPREVLDDVTAADWSPDGSSLAVIRQLGDRSRLEYPAGKVLAESTGYLSDVRVSPKGDRIAFMPHALVGDNRGPVVVVDLEGKEVARSPEYWGVEGLAWSADGKRVFYSASRGGGRLTVFAIDLHGAVRDVISDSTDLVVHDLLPGGRLLASTQHGQAHLYSRLAGEASEHELPWFGNTYVRVLSPDGRSLVFEDESELAGPHYSACFQAAPGSAPVRLGEGTPLDLSSDRATVLANVPSVPPRLMLYPTGSGAPRDISAEGFDAYRDGGFLPDGKGVFFCGAESGKGPRCYFRDLAGGAVRAVTPEGTVRGRLSPDGATVLARRPGQGWFLFPVDGAEGAPVGGLDDREEVLRWEEGGRSVLVCRPTEIPVRVERFDVASGKRHLVRELAPADRAGALRFWDVTLSADAAAWAYTLERTTSVLFVVESVR